MTRSLVLAALAACTALLTACGGGSPASPSEEAHRVGDSCADLVILGARGSTQNPELNSGVGTEVRLTTDRLIQLIHTRSEHSVALQAIRYDSAATRTVDDFMAHAAAGSRTMTSTLRSIARSCPDSRFALLGFSQGAQVVHGAATRMPSALARRVALVAMIADPRRDPGDRILHWTYTGRPATLPGKLGPGGPIDPDLRAVAISLCVAGDEICNDRGAPSSAPSKTHKHFYEQPSSVRSTAAELDRILQTRGL